MQLRSLFGPELTVPAGSETVEITGITADSRKAGRGVLFAALPGTKADGAKFIADAVGKGRRRDPGGGEHRNSGGNCRAGTAMPGAAAGACAAGGAVLSASQPEIAVAVTGTSGKTSVAEFTRQIFAALGTQGRVARHDRHRQARTAPSTAR